MSKVRLSKRAVDAFACDPGKDRTFLWDDAIAGFGLAAFPTGKKVFVAQYRQHGRSRRIVIGDYGRLTPEQARSEAKKLLGAVESGIDPIDQRRAARAVRTVNQVADDFMQLHARAKLKRSTATEYERLLKLYIRPALGSRRLIDVRRADLARLHSKLDHVPFAANRCIALMSAIWNWAGRRDEADASRNPAMGLERNKERARERYLKTDEYGQLGAALRLMETQGLPWDVDETKPNAKHIPKNNRVTAPDPFAAAAIRLLVLTGARLREILDARWDYVDWDRGLMFLPDSKTGAKVLYLSDAAIAVLRAIPRLAGNAHIIPGKTAGAPRADLKRPWEAVNAAANLKGLRLHDLRHSFASMGAGASLGLPMIGKLLGHSQPSTTARYSHLDADPMRRAAATIGERISVALGKPQAGEKTMPWRPARAA